MGKLILVSAGKSWSGWKLLQRSWGIFGELRVTRKRSGGVPGYENPFGLKGLVGRVALRELPMNASCRGMSGECVAVAKVGIPGCTGGSSREGVIAGVCGRDRS